MENLKEYLQEEKNFVSLREALYYAVFQQKEKGEDLAIFRAKENVYYTVHTVNAETAIKLGYELVVGFTEIVFVAKSDDDPEKVLIEFNERIKCNVKNSLNR